MSLYSYGSKMFVDREKELRALREMYELFLKGHLHGVVVYGLRKVGKTTLIKMFVSEKKGLRFDLSWVNSVESLVKLISKTLKITVNVDLSDPVDAIISALAILEDYARSSKKKFPVALDEFHTLIERLPVKIAKKYGLKRDEVYVDILWKLRALIENSTNIFWIFVSSIGWMKIKEYLREKTKAKGALLGVLEKLEVKPLDLTYAKELALSLMKNKNEKVAEEIARISGGIPRIVEILIRRYNTTEEDPLKLASESIRSGEFDELFESIIRFLAEFSRREFDTLAQVLKAVAEENKTAEAVAKYLNTTRGSAYNILEELTKLGLITKHKTKNRIEYNIAYPLMKEWLLLSIPPQKDITELLARAFGIAGESYLRELLKQAVGKRIELYEDKEGSIFYGTTRRLILNIEKVYSIKETLEFFNNIKNADIIAENNNILVFEAKIRTKGLSPDEITKLAKKLKAIQTKTKKKTIGIIALLEGEAKYTAISQAIRNGIIIMSPKAIRILAKKLDYPHW